MIKTRTGLHKLSFEKSFKILVHIFNFVVKRQTSLEEWTQSANKAWWRDANIYRSKGHMCGHGNVAENGSMGTTRWDESTRIKCALSEDTAFVQEVTSGFSSDADRRSREAHFPKAQSGGGPLGKPGH